MRPSRRCARRGLSAYLPTFVLVVELMIELSTENGYTAILSVPNDAFWALENPFHAALAEVKRLQQTTRTIFIDFHAEATSEKVALARMLGEKP